MDKVLKYQLYCVVEQEWKTVIVEEDAPIPTTCPVDTSHGIQAGSTSIIDKLQKNQILSQPITPIGGPRMANRGVQFVCTAGASEHVDYSISEPLHIKEGFLVTDNNVVGDVFDIQLFHPLDLNNPVWSYTLSEPVLKSGETPIENPAITEDELTGLIVRFTYHSSGSQDVKCVIGMRASIIV